jgi:peptidoglycan/LPS O-acetylase OafA/YrhL
MNSKQTKYRPEIDGLRGLAIIFIVLSHFNQLNFVSGGVNIFFVVSGYLITHILISQKIDAIKFYQTRFKKLYPDLFLIALTTFILFLILGDFHQWSLILRSFIASTLIIYNFFLIKIGIIYGQEDYINPFLHFWAICVIVQFYFAFPFILKFIFFIKKKFTLTENFIPISLIIISTVLILANYTFENNKLFNFYSPFSRVWQFLLGACFYFIVKSKIKTHLDKLSIYVGVSFIFIWQLNLEWFYPWQKKQILLTIATLFFLFSTKDNIFNKILSIKPLIYVGKISFLLFLIHLPVMYFISTWFEQWVVFISLVFVIFITYFYNKFKFSNLYRYITNFLFEKKIIISLSFFILLFVSNFYLIKKEYKIYDLVKSYNIIKNKDSIFKEKFKNTGNAAVDILVDNDGEICHDKLLEKNFLKKCSFINSENKKNFFNVGGSQMSALGFDLNKRLDGFNYYHLTVSGFLYLEDFNIKNKNINNRTNFKHNSEFIKKNRFIKKTILSMNSPSIVLLGARYPLFKNESYFDNLEGGIEKKEYYWDQYFEHINDSNKIKKRKWEDGFKNSVRELSKNENIDIILVYPIPEVGFYITKKLKKYKFFSNQKFDTSYDVFKNRTNSSFKLLDDIKGKNIHRIYPHTLFCDTFVKNRCVAHHDKEIFYSDTNHLSIKGAELVNNLIFKEVRKIELTNITK